MAEKSADRLAKKIWDYHRLNHRLKKADCILVLGSHDTRVAERAAELFMQGLAPFLLMSGGFGVGDKNAGWPKTEAEVFAKAAVKKGVPEDKILLEKESTNTGENIIFSKKLLEQKNFRPQKIIIVTKPYMERRALATFKKVWPGKAVMVASPEISFEEYPNNDISKDEMINLMVGDLQRIKIYPEKGFQVYQEIPDDVWLAYEKLLELGYNKRLY